MKCDCGPVFCGEGIGDNRTMKSQVAQGFRAVKVLSIVIAFSTLPLPAQGPSVVRIERKPGGGFQLLRNGKPYFIKGGGGRNPETLLAAGGNSVRGGGDAANLPGELPPGHRRPGAVHLALEADRVGPVLLMCENIVRDIVIRLHGVYHWLIKFLHGAP